MQFANSVPRIIHRSVLDCHPWAAAEFVLQFLALSTHRGASRRAVAGVHPDGHLLAADRPPAPSAIENALRTIDIHITETIDRALPPRPTTSDPETGTDQPRLSTNNTQMARVLVALNRPGFRAHFLLREGWPRRLGPERGAGPPEFVVLQRCPRYLADAPRQRHVTTRPRRSSMTCFTVAVANRRERLSRSSQTPSGNTVNPLIAGW